MDGLQLRVLQKPPGVIFEACQAVVGEAVILNAESGPDSRTFCLPIFRLSMTISMSASTRSLPPRKCVKASSYRCKSNPTPQSRNISTIKLFTSPASVSGSRQSTSRTENAVLSRCVSLVLTNSCSTNSGSQIHQLSVW